MDELPNKPGAGPETKPEPKASPEPHRTSFGKRKPVIIGGTIALAVFLFLGLHYFLPSLTHESTDNAFLDGDIVGLAPKVSGHVKKVYVTNNQLVKTGDPILEIDPRDFEVLLEQKKAALAAAESNVKLVRASFDLLTSQVVTAEATAKQSEAEAAASQASADKAAADFKRAEDLIHRGIISAQEFDAAKATAGSATASLNAAREKAVSDRSKVDAAKAQLEAGRAAMARAEAQSDESKVDIEQAELNLSYTRITAPQDGRIARKTVEAGDLVQVGQRLMALVLSDLWVTANFKETQLKNIRVGQPAEISIDSVEGRTFHGHVESVQAGSGAAFSLLPPENAVGNYVKVVQRVPVRIFFDGPPQTEHVLGPGMSVVPSVRVKSWHIPGFAILLGAIAIAGVAGWFWWSFAERHATDPATFGLGEPRPANHKS